MERPSRRGASKAAKAELAAAKLKQLKDKGGKGRLNDIEEDDGPQHLELHREPSLQRHGEELRLRAHLEKLERVCHEMLLAPEGAAGGMVHPSFAPVPGLGAGTQHLADPPLAGGVGRHSGRMAHRCR